LKHEEVKEDKTWLELPDMNKYEPLATDCSVLLEGGTLLKGLLNCVEAGGKLADKI